MKKMSPKKKVTWIINSVMTLSAIALVVIVHYIKAKYNLPTLVLYACSMPVQIGGFILFSKWLENSKWKDTVEEMGKEAEEEEAKSKPTPTAVTVWPCLPMLMTAKWGLHGTPAPETAGSKSNLTANVRSTGSPPVSTKAAVPIILNIRSTEVSTV